MSRLVIAEKPSVGRAVSAVVGADKAQKGYIEAWRIYRFMVHRSLGRTEISK